MFDSSIFPSSSSHKKHSSIIHDISELDVHVLVGSLGFSFGEILVVVGDLGFFNDREDTRHVSEDTRIEDFGRCIDYWS